MANGWNSGPDREATLRRVAIVLSSLPAPVAAQLLGSIDGDSKKAVRRTMTSLTDVDPLERRRALQAFKVSVQQPHAAAGDPAPPASLNRSVDHVELRRAADQASATIPGASNVVPTSAAEIRSGQAEAQPLSFLGDVDDDTLVRLLAAEHPQAVALVLATIAPAQAARVLPRLDRGLRTDALSRIGRLGDIPEAAVAEVAEHFKDRLSQRTQSERRDTGRRALDAILAAMPSSEPVTPTEPATRTAHRSNAEPPRTDFAQQGAVGPLSFPSADVPAVDLTHKLQVAQHTWPETPDRSTPQADAAVATQAERLGPNDPEAGSSAADRPAVELSPERQSQSDAPSVETVPMEPSSGPEKKSLDLESTDAIHQHLLGLSSAQLCQSLGKVETRDAMLALCGLPNQVTESVLAVLPRGQARKVRNQMNSLGSLHLREIDQAKERVAQASLASHGEMPNQVPLAA